MFMIKNNQNVLAKINTIVILIFITLSGYCQQNFHIVIQFNPPLDTNDISVLIENGKAAKRVPINYSNGKIDILEQVYAKYAILSIFSDRKNESKTYILTKNEATINFQVTRDISDVNYPFGVSKTTNATEPKDFEVIKSIMSYREKEVQEKNDFMLKYNDDLLTNDSLKAIYNQKCKAVVLKELELIRLHSNEYEFFWYFIFYLKGRTDIEPDSLLSFYKNTLYPKFKGLIEAEFALNYLYTRTIAINNKAPDFISTDINGNRVSLNQLQGKFVLLNFWATWCVPCVKELPLLKKIRTEIPEEKLVILSISLDRNITDLKEVIAKYNLNWNHIFNDDELVNKYNFQSGIPKTFLIDENGILVFKQLGELNSIENLKVLILQPKSSQ